MADVYFRAQRLAGDAVFADFVPNLAGIVEASGSVTGQEASTTGQASTLANVTVTGVVTGQAANTTGVTNTLTPETATGAVTGQEAATTGQILAVAPTPVDVTGTVQGQAAITSGIVVVEAASYATVTGDAQASPATTTGQVIAFGTVTATGAVEVDPATTTGKVGQFKDHSPELLMKLPDGTWIPINDDMHWIYAGFVDGTTYLKHDTLREAGWTMIANKETTDYPAPQTVGQPFNLYDGTSPESIQSANQILFGTSYTANTNPFQLSAYRVYAVTGQSYDVFIVVDPTGANQVTPLASFTANATGWIEFSVAPLIVRAGEQFDVVASVTPPNPAPTPIDATYDYLTPQNITVPAAGEIQHARGQPDIMRISYTDDVAGDQTALISNLSIGDTIEIGGVKWTVQVNTPDTGFADITVTPSIVGTIGVQTVTFTTNVPQDVTYLNDVDYWLTSPYAGDVKGIIGIDLPYPLASYNDTAYGIDITVVQLALSPDWDVVTPADSATGDPTTRLTRQETDWVIANARVFNVAGVMTTDNTWTTLGFVTLPLDSGYSASVVITAKRTDAFGIYHLEYRATAVNDGGTLSTGKTTLHEYSTNPALDYRVNISGNDAEFQVRGASGQDWHWTGIRFFREIV